MITRVATRDTELAGVPIPAGSTVMPMLGCGEPGRGALPGSGPLRHLPRAEAPHLVRPRRPRLPRDAPGPARDARRAQPYCSTACPTCASIPGGVTITARLFQSQRRCPAASSGHHRARGATCKTLGSRGRTAKGVPSSSRATVVPRLAKPARHIRYAPDGDRCRLCDFMTGHDAHLIAARPAVVPSQSGRRFAIARGPRLPRWLRQPRHGGGACWRRNTLGSAPRPKKSWVALLGTPTPFRTRSRACSIPEPRGVLDPDDDSSRAVDHGKRRQAVGDRDCAQSRAGAGGLLRVVTRQGRARRRRAVWRGSAGRDRHRRRRRPARPAPRLRRLQPHVAVDRRARADPRQPASTSSRRRRSSTAGDWARIASDWSRRASAAARRSSARGSARDSSSC